MMHFGPSQLDVFEDSLYVLNDLFYRVIQMDIIHHDEMVSLHQFSWLAAKPHALKVIHPYRQPSRPNPCDPNPCEGFCLLCASISSPDAYSPDYNAYSCFPTDDSAEPRPEATKGDAGPAAGYEVSTHRAPTTPAAEITTTAAATSTSTTTTITSTRRPTTTTITS